MADDGRLVREQPAGLGITPSPANISESERPPFAAVLLTGWLAIPSLLRRSSPSAIGWLVVAVVVYAINGMPQGRPGSHILVEPLERVSPAGAHLNTPAAVALPAIQFGILAALAHLAPSFVLGRGAHTVGTKRLRGPLSLETSTAPLPTGLEITSLRNTLISAIAPADPDRLPRRPNLPADRRQPTKADTGKVKPPHAQKLTPASIDERRVDG